MNEKQRKEVLELVEPMVDQIQDMKKIIYRLDNPPEPASRWPKLNWKKIFNVGSHVGLGYWSGSGLNDGRTRTSALICVGLFALYQVLQCWKKGDRGYNEVREFGIGAALFLVRYRFRLWESR